MKSRDIIIKAAFIVSAVALLFSVVTLIRALIVGLSVIFPIIQVVGSAAIFAICFWMFRMLKTEGSEEIFEADDKTTGSGYAEAIDEAEESPISLYDKYDLSDFEE